MQVTSTYHRTLKQLHPIVPGKYSISIGVPYRASDSETNQNHHFDVRLPLPSCGARNDYVQGIASEATITEGMWKDSGPLNRVRNNHECKAVYLR